MKLFTMARIEYDTVQCGLMAANVAQEASEALAESREQSRESSYFKTVLEPRGVRSLPSKHHSETVLYSKSISIRPL